MSKPDGLIHSKANIENVAACIATTPTIIHDAVSNGSKRKFIVKMNRIQFENNDQDLNLNVFAYFFGILDTMFLELQMCFKYTRYCNNEFSGGFFWFLGYF